MIFLNSYIKHLAINETLKVKYKEEHGIIMAEITQQYFKTAYNKLMGDTVSYSYTDTDIYRLDFSHTGWSKSAILLLFNFLVHVYIFLYLHLTPDTRREQKQMASGTPNPCKKNYVSNNTQIINPSHYKPTTFIIVNNYINHPSTTPK